MSIDRKYLASFMSPLNICSVFLLDIGKTAEQIQIHQTFVRKSWTDLIRKAKNVRGKLHNSVDYYHLITEVNNLAVPVYILYISCYLNFL